MENGQLPPWYRPTLELSEMPMETKKMFKYVMAEFIETMAFTIR
jgi:hypothetical protein